MQPQHSADGRGLRLAVINDHPQQPQQYGAAPATAVTYTAAYAPQTPAQYPPVNASLFASIPPNVYQPVAYAQPLPPT